MAGAASSSAAAAARPSEFVEFVHDVPLRGCPVPAAFWALFETGNSLSGAPARRSAGGRYCTNHERESPGFDRLVKSSRRLLNGGEVRLGSRRFSMRRPLCFEFWSVLGAALLLLGPAWRRTR